MPSPADALAIAVQHHQAGDLQAAERIYKGILDIDPDHADALHLLGVVAFQSGDLDRAMQCICRAIKLNGTVAKFHCNLGNVFQAQRKLDEAVQSFRRALELDPQFAEAYLNLGSAFEAQGRIDEAVDAYRQALNLKPHQPEILTNLGLALRRVSIRLCNKIRTMPTLTAIALCCGCCRAIFTTAGANTNGAGDRTSLNNAISRNRGGLAVPYKTAPSCCMLNKASATQFNSFVTPRL
jgi:tetratricopeptide (TPR) repeat protein